MGALLIAVGSAAVSSAGAGAGVSSLHNLTGHWTTEGTSLTLKQSGRVITWTGGPDNRAWIQTFKGTISEDRYGPTFSGTFQQDEPGRLPPRYSGTMKARIRDSCNFEFLSIVQAGQPTLSDIHFNKVPCVVRTKPLSRLNLILYKKRFVPDSGRRAPARPHLNASSATALWSVSATATTSTTTHSRSRRATDSAEPTAGSS
jgi:hypothetical protein